MIDKLLNRFGYRKATPAIRYHAAKINRLTAGFMANNLTSTEILKRDLKTLRGRSRTLAEDNDHIRKFLKMVSTNVVGPAGITLQNTAKDDKGKLDKLANDSVEAAWREWGKPANCTVTGGISFRELQKLITETVPRDGEVFTPPY